MKMLRNWLPDLLERLREAGRYKALYELEMDVSSNLRNEILVYQKRLTCRDLERRAEIQSFAFASDEHIAAWAKAGPQQQVEELARVTRMLARETAKVHELSEVNAALNSELKTMRRNEAFYCAWTSDDNL